MAENGRQEVNPQEKRESKYGAHLHRIGSTLLGSSFNLDTMKQQPARMKTGFPKLDKMLGGGLGAGLIVLGGSPGLGKSTLALNIAEHVSLQGTPVLYYSFEMPLEKMDKKLVVRTNFLSGNKVPFTVRELSDSEELRHWPLEKKKAYEAALGQLSKKFSKYNSFFLIEASLAPKPFTAERIADDVRNFMKSWKSEHGGEEKKPLVIVDYLQILPKDDTARKNDMRMSVEDSIRKMVSLSHEGVPILLISSLSRVSYKKPVDLDSFKETGSIEFSADVLLAIQFSAVHGGNEVDFSAEKKKPVRDVELSILKQRFGELGEVSLDYYAQYDCFMEKGQTVIGTTEVSVRPLATAAAASVGAVPDAPPESLQPPSDSEPETAPEEAEEEQSLSANPALPQRVRSAQHGFISNTLVAREMRQGNITPNVRYSYRVIPSKNIFTSIETSEVLSSYEYTVMDAIFALLDSGKTKFTLRNVLTMLSGNPHQVLSPQKRDQLSGIVEKLCQTDVNINCNEEMAERKVKIYKKNDFSGKLLSVEKKAEKKGDVYCFINPGTSMPLCAYTKASMQYILFPTTLLLAGAAGQGQRKKLSDTDDVAVIKHFLIARCEVLRKGKYRKVEEKGFRTISLKTDGELLLTLGLRKSDYQSIGAWHKRMKKVHDTVDAILEYFKLIGYIDGYDLKENFGFYIRAGEEGSLGVNNPFTLFP